MDIYEKIKRKYKNRKILAAVMMGAGCLAFALTILFVFIETIDPIPAWNQFHYWAVGLMTVLVTGGAIIFVGARSALKDIEKTLDRLQPDERECAIQEKAKAKTLRIYYAIIYPIIFLAASILLMLEVINFVAWIIIVVSFVALLVTLAILRKVERDRF